MKNYLHFILIVGCLFFSINFVAASERFFFYLQLTDKNNSPYSIDKPEDFLSDRAIQRRARLGIDYDLSDLPVNQEYINSIKDLGFNIHSKSKWLNGLTVSTNDSARIELIKDLQFVGELQYTGKILEDETESILIKLDIKAEILENGSEEQIHQLKGNILHEKGYHGEGVHIAVLDAGFYGVDHNHAFTHLYDANRILGTKNIVSPEKNVYFSHSHGTHVLSAMGAYLPSEYKGAATEAAYWLVQTEYDTSEYLMELDFWVSGAEFADSVGADLINSSLGYRTFDDPKMNFEYENMDGKTTRASIAAEMAANKGMLVVLSAGNDGDKSWRYIGSPADADGVLSVGSVNGNGIVSPFSSFGPSADNRVKPEVCARGSATYLVNILGMLIQGNGTSFATPIIAGLAACLLQASLDQNFILTPQEIIELIVSSANQYENPTDQMGYGIPDFEKVYQKLINTKIDPVKHQHKTEIWTDNERNIHCKRNDGTRITDLKIFDSTGNLVLQKSCNDSHFILHPENLNAGFYAVFVATEKDSESHKIILF